MHISILVKSGWRFDHRRGKGFIYRLADCYAYVIQGHVRELWWEGLER